MTTTSRVDIAHPAGVLDRLEALAAEGLDVSEATSLSLPVRLVKGYYHARGPCDLIPLQAGTWTEASLGTPGGWCSSCLHPTARSAGLAATAPLADWLYYAHVLLEGPGPDGPGADGAEAEQRMVELATLAERAEEGRRVASERGWSALAARLERWDADLAREVQTLMRVVLGPGAGDNRVEIAASATGSGAGNDQDLEVTGQVLVAVADLRSVHDIAVRALFLALGVRAGRTLQATGRLAVVVDAAMAARVGTAADGDGIVLFPISAAVASELGTAGLTCLGEVFAALWAQGDPAAAWAGSVASLQGRRR